MINRLVKTSAVAVISLSLLSACGESDIEAIEERQLAEAQRNVQGTTNETDTGAAMEPESAGVDLTEYELIFSDEFDEQELSALKWSTALPWGSDLIINGELQYYVDIQQNPDMGYNPFSFDGEALVINAIPTPDHLKSSANEQSYLSGAISSADKFDMTFGYIEARMDFPVGAGLWPAFWMLSTEFVDLRPQLFIAEGDGAKSDSVFHNYNYHDEEGNLRSPGQWQVSQETLTEGFHTFGVEWSEEELLFYVDGVPRYRVVGEKVSKQAMYLIANLAVGGVWTGPPDAQTQFPAQLKIDYIRAYKIKAD
jgi:beta-glucanase (GH16 family)